MRLDKDLQNAQQSKSAPASDLIAGLHDTERSVSALELRVLELTGAYVELQRMVESERAQARAKSEDLAGALMQARRVLRESRVRFDQMSRKLHDLETEVSKGDEYVRDLRAQVAEKNAEILRGGAYAERVNAEINECKREYELLAAETEAIRKAALCDKIVMREYIDSFCEQLAEIPALREAQQHLIAQTEDLIAAVQAESAQIVTLIGTVQSSHFWKLKNLLNRLRAQMSRR